ncbi:MAG: ParB N-terminal domain-containing protein, partial [Planctomycetes bacterium]|nr:ParB N-terminal domain-containing protein [Planctomycetota bacterium]
MNIKVVPIDSLVMDPSNVRTHDVRNLDAICASLRRFGQAEPLVVQRGTGRIIGGNGRLQAMRQLGWTECEVVELEMDDLQATSLSIALNRTAELAGWDEPALAKLLQQLKAEDSLDGVGYSTEDLDALVQQLREQEEIDRDLVDEGAEPPPAVAASKLGDLWCLGDHRLLCGDSTSIKDVHRVMAGEKAALVATDP